MYLCKIPDNSRVDDPLTGYDVRPLESFVPSQLPSCQRSKQPKGSLDKILIFKVIDQNIHIQGALCALCSLVNGLLTMKSAFI